MIVGTANIGRKGTAADAARAIERLHSAATRVRGAVFLGLQEIDGGDPADEHGLLEQAFDDAEGWRATGWRTQVPILDRARVWRPTGRIRRLASPGIERIQPPRWIIGRTYRHRVTGRQLAILNIQQTADGWTGRATPGTEPMRREHWDQGWEVLSDQVDELVEAGFDVVVLGDLNRNPIPLTRLHPRAVVVAHRGLDWVIAIPAKGHEVRSDDVREVDLGIDSHRGLLVGVRFPRRRVRRRPAASPVVVAAGGRAAAA